MKTRKQMKSNTIPVKYDWENNPKVHPKRLQLKAKAPRKMDNREKTPDATKHVKKGNGQFEKVPIVRFDMNTTGTHYKSPKVCSKYSSKDGSINIGGKVKEAFTMDFNRLFSQIMMEAQDPNAAPPAPPAPPPPPAGAPDGMGGAQPPVDGQMPPEEGEEGLEGEPVGVITKLEDLYTSVDEVVANIQDPNAQEGIAGIKDGIAEIYEMLTGTPIEGAEEGMEDQMAGGVGDVPNMEQGDMGAGAPPPGGDPNAQQPVL